MQVLLFPFFLSRLLILDAVFLTRFFFSTHPGLKAKLIVFLLLLMGGIYGTSFFFSQEKNLTTLLPLKNSEILEESLDTETTYSTGINVSLLNTPQYTLEQTPENILNKINFYQDLLRQQPNQRDVLINLAILENFRGNTALANEFYKRAQALDPNNPIFSK